MSRSNDGLPMLPPWLADTEVTGVGEGNFRNYEPPPVQNLPQDEVIPETPEPPEGFFARRGRGEDRSAESDKKKGKGWFRNKNKDQPSLEDRVGPLLPNSTGPRPAQRNNWAEATGRHEWATPRPENAEAPRHSGTDPLQQTEQGGPGRYPPADRPDAPAPPAPGPGPQWGPDGAPTPTSAAPNAFQAPAADPPAPPVRQPGEPAPEFDRLRPHHPIPPQPAPEPWAGTTAEGTGGAAGPSAVVPEPPPFLPPPPPLPDPPADSPRSGEGPATQQPLRRLPDLPPSPSEASAGAGNEGPGEPSASVDSATPTSREPADPPVPAPAPGPFTAPDSFTAPPPTPDPFTAPDSFTAPAPAPAPESTPAPEPTRAPDPLAAPDSLDPPALAPAPGPAPVSEPFPTPDSFRAPESNPAPTPRIAPTDRPRVPESAPPPHDGTPGDQARPGPGTPNPAQWRTPEANPPIQAAQWQGPEVNSPRQPLPPPPAPRAPGPRQQWQQNPGPPPQGPGPAQYNPAPPQQWQQQPPQQHGGAPTRQQGGPPAPQQWQQNPAQFGAPGPGAPSLDDVSVRRAKKASGHGWRKVVHHASGGRINPGMSAEERRLQELVARIRQPVRGDYRIAVLSLKGGVGKTTTTIGLGSTFASVRGDRVIAVDANPDFGTLSQRVPLQTRSTVRDLLLDPAIERYSDVRRHTSQATSRLEVLASERDPAASEAFNEDEYRAVARILQRFYNIILTDCGTGLMHSAMAGVLQLAHSLVLISPTAIDGAQSASATLDWLSLHGYHHLVQNAVVVINSPRDGTPNIDVQQLRQYFLSRCRAVHMIPFDPHMSEGAEIDLPRLKKETKRAYVELAATVADDFTQSYRPQQGG
ncbi:MinD/ParA family ATP-binding protein [Nocardia sienata]|uniref:MinD/ParA family ATP-binding protein n=1 Tax=Nocardia sienata TaxID=248552 RepID=UPI001FE1C6FB|nr:MinD/ParA family protein [Nocardia sienata]